MDRRRYYFAICRIPEESGVGGNERPTTIGSERIHEPSKRSPDTILHQRKRDRLPKWRSKVKNTERGATTTRRSAREGASSRVGGGAADGKRTTKSMGKRRSQVVRLVGCMFEEYDSSVIVLILAFFLFSLHI